MKKIIKAFLTAFALVCVYHAPLSAAAYETKLDYVIASIYELLGNYDFKFVLTMAVCYGFYHFAEGKRPGRGKNFYLLGAFFAFWMLIGKSYYEIGNWGYCFGSLVNFIKSVLVFLGATLFFGVIMELVSAAMEDGRFTDESEHFFQKHGFLKAFLILLCAYLPFVILSFPGNLCWDVIGQIEQVILDTGYSTHHPLAHTLLVGGLTELGKVLFGSYEAGLFLYMLLQTALLAAALAATIAVLAKRNVKFRVLLAVLVIYCITPVYSNVASTALKDVPFCAFVIGYVVCFALLLETPALLQNKRFVIGFIALQVGVILLRNNGMALVCLSGIGGLIFLWKKCQAKEKMYSLITLFGAGILIGKLILFALTTLCSAESGSKGEMLSIPFQQTARYLQCYKEELGTEEKAAIEAVLGDADTIAAKYDPDISDPVKALFKKDASATELVSYLKAWATGLCKHPAVYVEAFLAHIYGWFTPSVPNAIRYEASYDVIHQGGLFPNAEKLLIFYYRFANRFTLLGVLENTGMAVWALFFLAVYQKRHHKKAFEAALLPLWVSLLVCMASPCFFNHPRYAFPILFTLPFLYGFTVSGQDSSALADKGGK